MKPDELKPVLRKNGDTYIYMEHESDSQYFNRKQMADALESAMDSAYEGRIRWFNKIKELRGIK